MQKKDTKESRSTFYVTKPINLNPSQKRQVKNMVHALITSIISDIEHKKKTGKITKQLRTYTQRRVNMFQRKRRGLIAHVKNQTITKKDWWDAINKYEQKLHSLPEYVCLETFLQQHISQHQNLFIDKLSKYIVKEYLQQNLSSKSIAKIKNTFIKDLEMKPSTLYVVGVFGLQLKHSGIILTEKLRIDRTTKHDLEFESSGLFEDTTSIIYPDAIYRFESGVNTTGTHMAELVTAALCLYKVGAVRLGKQISYLDSIVYYDNLTETPGDREKQGIPIIFTETDCKKFPDFWKKFQSFLSYKPDKIFKKHSHLDMAYSRYYDSLLKGSSDSRIASIMACLETLLGESPEISYKLQIRIARLLSTLGFDPNIVIQDILLAYKIRSSFVHGSEEHRTKELNKRFYKGRMGKEAILLKIQEYTRIVFLVVLLYGKEKKELIHFLTMAQVDTSSLKKFEQKINLMKNYLNIAQISKWQNDLYLLQKIFSETEIKAAQKTNKRHR